MRKGEGGAHLRAWQLVCRCVCSADTSPPPLYIRSILDTPSLLAAVAAEEERGGASLALQPHSSGRAGGHAISCSC